MGFCLGILGILLSFNVFASDLQCSDLFSVQIESSLFENVDVSLRRFDQSIEKTDLPQKSKIAYFWAKKVGKSVEVFGFFKSLFSNSTVFHENIYLSPDQKLAISKGTDNEFRIYDSNTASHPILADTISERESHSEVVYVSNNFFVIAVESTFRVSDNSHLKIDRFYPEKIVLLDYQGHILAKQHLDQILKHSEVNEEKDLFLTLTADSLTALSLKSNSPISSLPLESSLLQLFNSGDHVVYQTFHFSKDGEHFVLAATSRRSHSSKIIIYKNDSTLFSSPEILQIFNLPSDKIYKLETYDNKLKVFSSGYESNNKVYESNFTIAH